jgi:hypothetical protein
MPRFLNGDDGMKPTLIHRNVNAAHALDNFPRDKRNVCIYIYMNLSFKHTYSKWRFSNVLIGTAKEIIILLLSLGIVCMC